MGFDDLDTVFWESTPFASGRIDDGITLPNYLGIGIEIDTFYGHGATGGSVQAAQSTATAGATVSQAGAGPLPRLALVTTCHR